MSLSILNEMTYMKIWNNFSKWVADQAELGNVLNIYPLGYIMQINKVSNFGINLKINDDFLNDYSLKWNTDKFNTEMEITSSSNIVKLNIGIIGDNLNIAKIYVQNGLQNIFKGCMNILSENNTSVIELGVLGNIYCQNKKVFQIPMKINNDSNARKKITIRTMFERPLLLDKIGGKGNMNIQR